MKYDLTIIDGSNLIHRMASTMGDLQAIVHDDAGPKPVLTGGIYGSLKAMRHLFEKYKAPLVVVWECEHREHNFRYQLFPEYKAGRTHSDELRDQRVRLMAILSAIGVKQYVALDSEADDIAATLVQNMTTPCMVYSGDSDLRQLVSPACHIIAPRWGKKPEKIYDEQTVLERHGVPPKLIPDLKALAGDSSDGIPGVPGVGQKTAVQLLNQYGSLKRILQEAQRSTFALKGKKREAIFQNTKQLETFYRLTTLIRNARMQSIEIRKSEEDLQGHLRTLEFQSLYGSAAYYGLTAMGE